MSRRLSYEMNTNWMQIEIVVGAAQAANVIPQPKSLAERTAQPKAQPKSAASDKHGAAAKKAGQTAGRGRNKRRGAGAARSARPAKKTAEELDSEMADYFDAGANNGNANEGAAGQPAAAAAPADAAMEEDILVCLRS